MFLTEEPLLHRVCWKVPSTYADVVQQYCHYVERKYGQNITVVFDGYGSSTKDHEHQRRGKTKFSDVALQLQMEVNCNQAEFLSNKNNKTQLIELLANAMRTKGHDCITCDNDADKTIVSKGLEMASQCNHTTVVADDTDILVLLLNMWEPSMSDVVLRHEARKSIKKDLELISVKETVTLLPDHVCRNILFIHAWGGCDTTSAAFGQGKTAVMKLVEQNSNFIQKICSTFNDPFATKEQVSTAGVQLAIRTYGN